MIYILFTDCELKFMRASKIFSWGEFFVLDWHGKIIDRKMRIFNRPSVSTRTSGSFPFVLWRLPAPYFPSSHYLHCTLCIAISNWLTFERSIWDRSDTEYNMTNENEEYSWRIEHTIDNRRYHPCIYTCFTHFSIWS